MAAQNLILNAIPFTALKTVKEFSFTTEKREGFFPISVHDCTVQFNNLFPERNIDETPYLYTDFCEKSKGAKSIKIDLTRSIRFSKHYYTWLIHNYFSTVADITESNFIRDVEVWFEAKEESKYDCTGYKVFTIRVQIDPNTDAPELVISFDGISLVHNKSVLNLDIDNDLFKWAVYQRKLHYYDELPDAAKADYENVFPILNNRIKYALKIPVAPSAKVINKYKIHFGNLEAFVKKYIATSAFKNIIPLTSDKFRRVDAIKIKNTTPGSNELEFANSKTDINPYNGLKKFGPFSPCPHQHVNMFFICHENDKDTAVQLAKYFHNGLKNFPPLKELLKVPLTIKKEEQIVFKNIDNPTIEIKQQLAQKTFDSNTRYIAIYLTPYGKHDGDPTNLQFYYQVKEELLKYRITSQALETKKISDPYFHYYLINIGIAILAKLDGVPWRLKRSLHDELVVGVGAFKAQASTNRYIGSAFCFSNDGHFYGFECCSATDTFMLAGSIGKAIRNYSKQHTEVKRLVIHFYKTMSNRELEPIREELFNLNLAIPVVIITINKTESKDLLIFDTNCPDLIPVSGTFIHTGWNQYLLCNNTRYSSDTSKIESFPFPVKLKISSTDEALTKDITTIKELIDQVYQFSRMYWKSVRQQNLPVTIKYPEMVAEIFPHFESNIIPPFGQNNLWFL